LVIVEESLNKKYHEIFMEKYREQNIFGKRIENIKMDLKKDNNND
jgi:hypothetical protein